MPNNTETFVATYKTTVATRRLTKRSK